MDAPCYVLTVSGSDSSGGAGMQADNRAVRAAGAFPLNVLTAVTLQTPKGVEAVETMSPDFTARQLHALLTAYPVAAVKSGMLASAAIVERVADALDTCQPRPYVLDPVLCATSGEGLLEPEGVALVHERLLPRAWLATPNRDELARIAETSARDDDAVLDVAAALAGRHGCSVLVKGGHGPNDRCDDHLVGSDGTHRVYPGERIDTLNTRGTGCALAAFIAARLARSDPLDEAIRRARDHLARDLSANAGSVWRGPGPAMP